ncbi:hypothetical protein PENSTE_c001G01403 [Penicillium steckii]|uniref:GS catalytic domain-containing protein n=1 Tax=Penicillium steckii TaxID=303698 RepID=A0A1V6U0E8_9EURO|nr:hypothetical protein PENSTE_c001G01403 [Penicillium steckii]
MSSSKMETEDCKSILENFLLQTLEVNLIRLQWQDYAGVIRAISKPRAIVMDQILSGQPFEAGEAALSHGYDGSVLPPTPNRHYYHMYPDFSSLRLTPDSKTAVLMCELKHVEPGYLLDENDELCPRRALLAAVKALDKKFDYSCTVTFEVEFLVMRKEGKFHRAFESLRLGESTTSSLRDPLFEHVEECIAHLQSQGVSILEVRGGGRKGQFQMLLFPLRPVQAVDQLVFVHETLKTVFASHGYVVCMLSNPFGNSLDAGEESDFVHPCLNVHLSRSQKNRDKEDKFFAGIFKRLPSICAFCLPHRLSYRKQDESDDELTFWQMRPRLIPIRWLESWEIPCVDGTANMYLALTAILKAGYLGLLNSEPSVGPEYDPQDNKKLAKDEQLPQCLNDALRALQKTKNLSIDGFRSSMIDHYIQIKRHEMYRDAVYDDIDKEEEVRIVNFS